MEFITGLGRYACLTFKEIVPRYSLSKFKNAQYKAYGFSSNLTTER